MPLASLREVLVDRREARAEAGASCKERNRDSAGQVAAAADLLILFGEQPELAAAVPSGAESDRLLQAPQRRAMWHSLRRRAARSGQVAGWFTRQCHGNRAGGRQRSDQRLVRYDQRHRRGRYRLCGDDRYPTMGARRCGAPRSFRVPIIGSNPFPGSRTSGITLSDPSSGASISNPGKRETSRSLVMGALSSTSLQLFDRAGVPVRHRSTVTRNRLGGRRDQYRLR